MRGLKRGTVKLLAHDKMWKHDAQDVINTLRSVLGDTAQDIAHVGSTAINGIYAKPIIDILIAVNNIDDILPYIAELEKHAIIFRGSDREGQYLLVMGDFEKDTRTHHIHVVKEISEEHNNYINFRDYLNAHPHKAREYEKLKLTLAEKFPNDRNAYTDGKNELVAKLLSEAREWKKGQINEL